MAIIGTNGIPARYGGFETLAENLVANLGDKYSFTVYCSSIYGKSERTKYYKNARLIYLSLKANGWQSILYDVISLFHAWLYSDVILILGPAAGFALPLNFIFRKKVIVNHGGLNEWERKKYSGIQSKISFLNHKTAAKFATHRIADNSILAESIKNNFGKKCEIIRYGGDHVKNVPISDSFIQKYPFSKDPCAVSVSRAQVDNNLHIVLKAFETIKAIKLVLISNWQVSKYGIDLKNKYKNHQNIIVLDAIYNQEELNLIRSNATFYIHSHSQCGTAPSLVEAICLKLPIISFDVPTNRETTQNKAHFFSDSDELFQIVESINTNEILRLKEAISDIAENNYSWKSIAIKYAKLFD